MNTKTNTFHKKKNEKSAPKRQWLTEHEKQRLETKKEQVNEQNSPKYTTQNKPPDRTSIAGLKSSTLQQIDYLRKQQA